MEERITASERQLQAAQEIDEEFAGDRLVGEFRQLERSAGGSTADYQLLQLKQRMGLLAGGGAPTGARQLGAGEAGTPGAGGAAPQALPAPAAPPAAIEAEGPDVEHVTGDAELIAEIEQLRALPPKTT
jgi:phage shock protein A